MMQKKPYNRLLKHSGDEAHPLAEIANLFDAAMVFAVALMVALVSSMGLNELLSNEKMTIIKNPGKDNMELIIKEKHTLKRYKAADITNSKRKKGKKVGTAYQLQDGSIVYIPD